MVAGRDNSRNERRKNGRSNRNGDLNRKKTHRMRSNMGMDKEKKTNISSIVDVLKGKKEDAVKSE